MASRMGLAGPTYLVQASVVGAGDFSHALSIAIVVAWVLDVGWIIWLAVVA